MHSPHDASSEIPNWSGLPSDGPAPSFAAARSLKRELLAELRAGWDQGNPRPPEEFLGRWPADLARDPDVASLLFEDYCQRQRHSSASAAPRIEEYEERFKEQKDSLQHLFREHALLASLGGAAAANPSQQSSLRLALPGVGEELFDFRLRHELGRGAFARVFLAEQAGLADRPVVLKVSAIDGDEPQTLAQLQHTNIVPIYSVHEDPRAGLRAVCMPYFGGESLSRILRAIWANDDPPQKGAQLVEALAVRAKEARLQDDPPPVESQANDNHCPLADLRGRSYLQATAWIIARLAEALQHAHDRGVFHRDIKPSNILLAADGQPMLLDFNLAHRTHNAQAAATLGGTVAYMAPEHLRALASRDPTLIHCVDHRADLYSLGMVLFEMVAGQSPFDQSASYSPLPALIEAMAVERSQRVPSLRRHRPDVPWSLESIARKCLAPEAGERYQKAEHLAEDLRRFLEDRPLRHARELSVRERIRKWMRRHPRLTTSGAVSAAAAALLITGFTVLVGTRNQLAAAKLRVVEGERAEALQRKHQFQIGHQRALCLVHTTAELNDHVRQGMEECRKTLALYDVLAGDHWQEHRLWKPLSAHDRAALAEDIRELLLVLARAQTYLAAPDADFGLARALAANLLTLAPDASGSVPVCGSALFALAAGHVVGEPMVQRLRQAPEAFRKALILVERARAIPGLPPSVALLEDRALYLERLGDRAASAEARAMARRLQPTGARDHYELARAHAFNRRYAEAVTELKQALLLNPRHYWSWLQLGICHEEVGEYALSLGDFSACTALWPEFAWGYFNRGRALNQLGKKAEALADYTLALRLDPGFGPAHFNRGLVALDLGKPQDALADFESGAELGQDDARLYACRGVALEQLGRHREAEEAFGHAWQREPHNTLLLVAFGFAVSRRLPGEAEAAFARVLRADPRNVRALYGMGMLAAARVRRSQEALLFFTRALELDPSFTEARRARANVLAHQGDWGAACQDIELCVKGDPSGATLYAGACVYALMAAKCPSPVQAQAAGDQAVALLAAALEQGYGRAVAATDADLESIRNRPEFSRLLREGRKGKTP
jgi:serine/threonine protein kinase/Tfp pilus assembly protein PilF